MKRIRGSLKSSEKYQIIFQLSPAAIALMSPAGIITDLNGRVYDFLQYKPEEVIGKHFTELPFITQDGRRKLTENLANRLRGEVVPPYEVEFVSKSGDRHFGLLDISLIKDDQGNPIEILAMFSDITALKQNEEKLRHLNKELDDANLELQRAYTWMRRKRDQLRTQLFEEDFVFLIDRDSRIEGVSEKVIESLGMQRAQLIGTLLTDLLTEEALDLFRREMELAVKGIANEITVGLTTAAGKQVYSARMVRFNINDRRLIMVVFRSV